MPFAQEKEMDWLTATEKVGPLVIVFVLSVVAAMGLGKLLYNYGRVWFEKQIVLADIVITNYQTERKENENLRAALVQAKEHIADMEQMSKEREDHLLLLRTENIELKLGAKHAGQIPAHPDR